MPNIISAPTTVGISRDHVYITDHQVGFESPHRQMAHLTRISVLTNRHSARNRCSWPPLIYQWSLLIQSLWLSRGDENAESCSDHLSGFFFPAILPGMQAQLHSPSRPSTLGTRQMLPRGPGVLCNTQDPRVALDVSPRFSGAPSRES